MLRYEPAAVLAVFLSLAMGSSNASADSVKVAFSNCEEFVGEGPVPLVSAQSVVPEGYTITAAAEGQALIVVRMTRCEAVKVDGAPAVPTTISQIGVSIACPDGTGASDGYTVIYVTNNLFLAEALDRIGMPASYDPAITYEYTRNDTGNGGVLYGAVPDAKVAYFLHGAETEPAPNTQRHFIAGWWHGKGDSARVRQQTIFPAISFGDASNVTLYTSRFSALGQLIGGNTYGNFSMLASRGVYASAEMIVTDSER